MYFYYTKQILIIQKVSNGGLISKKRYLPANPRLGEQRSKQATTEKEGEIL